MALLPTPEAKLHDSGPDYARASRPGSGGDDLTTAVHRHLLPTPMTSDTRPGSGADLRRNDPQLRSLDRLLPTPVTTDAASAGRVSTTTGTMHPGTSLTDAVRTLLPEPRDTWGQYAPAVHRWERVTGRHAPPATERGTQGQPRLSPRFVEWLMGLPDGWVVDVAGPWVQEDLFGATDPATTRAEQLKMLGNGVVPQQAAAAITDLLQHLPEHALAALRGEQS